MDSEALVRVSADTADLASGFRASAVPLGNGVSPVSPWMRGFHGAIVDVGDMPADTLRSLALTHRSTGLGRMALLTALPDAPAIRAVPRSTSGERPVADATRELPLTPIAPTVVGLAEQSAEVRAAAEMGAFIEQVVVTADEPLGAFIDRRLREAQFLLLPNRGFGYAACKRIIDLVLATVLLVLSAPLFVTLVVLIRCDSAGPAIFRQQRVTRGGRIFTFYKFRTMYRDARERFPQLYDHHAGNGAIDDDQYYKLADDPRNTRVGRWLRRTTLDELPNLLNVLRGDLTMVGPRPDLPELVRKYRPEELACLFAKAGLTGMAQVAGRSLLTVRERLTLDLRYVAHQTTLLDIRILWRTVVVVLSGKGAF